MIGGGKHGDLDCHSQTQYHKLAIVKSESFIQVYKNPSYDIRNRVETSQGNVSSLLRFRIDNGDKVLENHLMTAKNNATHISKTSTNELINHCGNEVLSLLLNRIHKAKYYCVLFDETTDVSHIFQLSILIRYIYENMVREDFIGFVDLHKDNYSADALDFDTDNESNTLGLQQSEPTITGEILGSTVVKKLKSVRLDLLSCVGIGCAGCSVNMSTICGAAITIQKSAKNAMICPYEVIKDFDNRFSSDNMQCFNLNFLMPSNLMKFFKNTEQLNESIKDISNQYSELFGESTFSIEQKLKGELNLLENKLKSDTDLTTITSAITFLDKLDCDYFPVFSLFIKILIPLPISIATAERSFSSLRLLKTWLRSRMREER
ncbi:uncharacterized protein LOC111026282 [Myzus persicae]|uniref:uncharacterized protein LOC111026282 n=1 Tax=Myzus persicae TaxID=13164 RepID=UPI000B93649B|nr:uncharacterized protein LOC111026282 [Myzus persicae]